MIKWRANAARSVACVVRVRLHLLHTEKAGPRALFLEGKTTKESGGKKKEPQRGEASLRGRKLCLFGHGPSGQAATARVP